MEQALLEGGIFWYDKGAKVEFINVEKTFRTKKLYKESFPIDNRADLSDILELDYNFVSIVPDSLNLICLDVENMQGSIKKFNKILDDSSIDINDYYHEISMNGGYHIFFKNPGDIHKNTHRNVTEDILYDILVDGRCFMSPSKIGNKRYTVPSTLNIKNQLFNEIPAGLLKFFR